MAEKAYKAEAADVEVYSTDPGSTINGVAALRVARPVSQGQGQTNSGPGWASKLELFWAQVDKSGDCWIWTGRVTADGHGVTGRWSRSRTTDVKAHHISWFVAHGSWPPFGMVVRHRCDNARCVRPEHLELGTDADNVADRVARGRSAAGNRNGRARLTEAQVREVAALADAGVTSLAEIGRRFGVDHGTVRAIARRETWRHLWLPVPRLSTTIPTTGSES